MIEAECTTCGDPGPHPVQQDHGHFVSVTCAGCMHGFTVWLDIMPTPEVPSN